MVQGTDPSAPGGDETRPVMRPVKISMPRPGSHPEQGTREAEPRYRGRSALVTGAVVLGVIVGALPGAALALSARIDAHAANRRALAAERTLQTWEQQQAVASASSPTTPSPTVSSTDSSTGQPTDRTTKATPERNQFSGDGTYRVGSDIVAGTWQSNGNSGCHWERLRESRTKKTIVAFGNPVGTAMVTIRSSDDVFTTSKCNDWFLID